MTTRTILPPASPVKSVPPLEDGARLSRDEFERQCEAMPHLKPAELLRGVVYMPSPVRLPQHAAPHGVLVTWIFMYQFATPGLLAGDNATVRLGPEDEPQPDVLLMISAECGGQAAVGQQGYVENAPELAAEVAAGSASYDLGLKLSVYQERGVRAYVVWRVEDQVVDWFVRRGDSFQRLQAGADGILRSEVFPGLWLDAAGLLEGDGSRMMAVLQEGIASPEHTAFVERLRKSGTEGAPILPSTGDRNQETNNEQ